MANPTDEDWKRMSKLIDYFFYRADTEPFREPVAWKEMGLTDYPEVIKEPMDLGTIRKRLKRGEHYKSLYQVADDVRKVWTNCMTYNADGSDFFKLAESLQKRWDDRYTKLLQECKSTSADINGTGGGDAAVTGGGGPSDAIAPTSSGGSGRTTSLMERRSFAKSLYTISKEDLGKLLVDVEAKCPEALSRNSAEDEIELNVDVLSPAVLQELTAFVNSVRGSKKKAPGGGTGVASGGGNGNGNNASSANAGAAGGNGGGGAGGGALAGAAVSGSGGPSSKKAKVK